MGGDIASQRDSRLKIHGAARGGLAISDYKAEKKQFFETCSALLLRRLRSIAYRQLVTEPLVKESFRRMEGAYQDTMMTLCLVKRPFRLHFLLDGGAIHSSLHRVPILEIINRGRWASKAICQKNLTSGRAVGVGIEQP